MEYQELVDVLEHVGKDPSRLIFEDELTGIHNRRFLLSYFEHRVCWETGEDYPLALLVIDLDHFKDINDTHGHDTGDQVLTWIATLLKEVVGDEGMAVRYGGDEFMIVLPGASRQNGRQVADRLLQYTRDRPFHVRASGVELPVTVSIGVASASEDAMDSKGLLQAADTALYHAKQSGRDRAAAAGDIDPKKVFSRAALHRLQATGIVGRDDELSVVADSLEVLSQAQSRFLVFEGPPGSGKTTLLDTIRDNLTVDDAYVIVKVWGDQQEAYRPYYMLQRILVALLNQREDKGSATLEGLTDVEMSHLAHVIPQLKPEDASEAKEEPDSQKRQAIFATLARFLTRLVDYRPLPYRNMIGTDVDSAGTDPFAFQLRYIAGGNSVGADQPQGIIEGGAPIGAAVGNVTSEAHDAQAGVTSYVTFRGSSPDGFVFLETVSVGSISCTEISRRIGRGKNATTERVRSVSADFNIVFGFDGPASIPVDPPANIVWAEMHFRDVGSGDISKRRTVSPAEAEVSGTATLDLPDGTSSPLIEFVVDYVNPVAPFMMYSYDPGRNSNLGFVTTAGFDGSTWSNFALSTTVGDGRFPVASTPAATVTCN